jgi:hypothetical protein
MKNQYFSHFHLPDCAGRVVYTGTFGVAVGSIKPASSLWHELEVESKEVPDGQAWHTWLLKDGLSAGQR